MNHPFATFDTITIDAELARAGLSNAALPVSVLPIAAARPAAHRSTPLLARLPRLATLAPPTATPVASATQQPAHRERIDAPAVRPVGTHTISTYASAAAPVEQAWPAEPLRPATRPATAPPIAATPTTAVAPLAVATTRRRDDMTELLLGWERAITPYSRWIALAAVVAALGLTAALLRGGPSAPAGDAPNVSPRAAVATPGDSAETSIANRGFVSAAAAAPWPASSPKPLPKTGSLATLGAPRVLPAASAASAESSRSAASALGPIAAPPRAVLAQRVLAPESPLAAPTATDARSLRVAQAPVATTYPTTSSFSPSGTVSPTIQYPTTSSSPFVSPSAEAGPSDSGTSLR
ncbi:MAG: hypothetical protein ACRCT8_07400 [Lacipirellulaceae bacterium]